jgi:hypothetical protein
MSVSPSDLAWIFEFIPQLGKTERAREDGAREDGLSAAKPIKAQHREK